MARLIGEIQMIALEGLALVLALVGVIVVAGVALLSWLGRTHPPEKPEKSEGKE